MVKQHPSPLIIIFSIHPKPQKKKKTTTKSLNSFFFFQNLEFTQ
jgi:hypothetical protein